MKLPRRIFFTGVPGSRWSGIAQILEEALDLNTSDRTPLREYVHDSYSGHKGAYFGKGMEFEAKFGLVDEAHQNKKGTRLIKSHEWSRQLYDIVNHFPNDAMMVVYRPTFESFKWWKEAGGFGITYPSYAAYENDSKMLQEIHSQTIGIESFCLQNQIALVPFDKVFFKESFGIDYEGDLSKFEDVRVAYITWNG